MKSLVVYESHWGNTAAIARAVAEGIGPETRVLHTDEASPGDVSGADLLVVGAPLVGFQLTTDESRKNIANQGKAPSPADLSHPSMRHWLESLPRGSAVFGTFETRIWWSLGSAAKRIARTLAALGYRQVGRNQRFIVKGAYGPLKEGEVDRARAWGAELAKAAGR